MTIGLTNEGLPCLCKKTRSGKVSVVRVITAEETAALCGVLYALHKRVHPGEDLMVLPYGKGSALAVKEVCLSDGVETPTHGGKNSAGEPLNT